MVNEFRSTRFLFVVNTFRSIGGAERQALILASYLKDIGVNEVSFLAFEDGREFRNKLEGKGFNLYFFPFKHHEVKYKKLVSYFQLVRFLKLIKPDVYVPYVAESNKIVSQIWKYTGAKFAFWNQREEGRKLFGTKLENKLIRNVSAIVSNSYEGRDALVRVYGLDPRQIHVINNGVIPYDGSVDPYDWYKHFGIEVGRPIVSMIANITDRKDHKTLLKAWALVIQACKKEKLDLPFLALAGRKEKVYDTLRMLAFDLKLCDHIGFTGALPAVQGLITQSSFCVFSSNLEGCPNGVLECMERGKAVVGTRISGIMQALGMVYRDITFSKPNDEKDLADKILNLYRNPNLVKKIASHNTERIRKEFSVERMAVRHLELIKERIFIP